MRIYNYIHHNLLCNLHISLVQNWLKIDENWKQNDLMIIFDMFKWMFKFKSESLWITKIMINKFNMYTWHLQKMRDQKNYKWLQNMFYDLIQQVIQQSSVYYLAYIAFQEDHNHCLIFYSYYAQYQNFDN